MNIIFLAVFVACACFVNGQTKHSSESFADGDNETDGQDTLDNINENSTAVTDDMQVKDVTSIANSHYQYWPQIIIIKPMENRPPLFGLGNLLPFAHMYATPFVNTLRPSSITTISTTTHHTFSTHHPQDNMAQELLPPSPEAREHETDGEIAEQEAAATTTEPETEATTRESSLNELVTESDMESMGETESDIQSTDGTKTNSCTTPSGASGECISVYNCQPLLALIHKKDRTSQDLDLLQKSQCGYEGSSPAVCCPKQQQQPQGNCYTPEGKVGQCISLYSCAHLANMLKPPVPSENIAYVQKSKCEGTEQYSVCCGPPPDRNPVLPSGNCNSMMTAYPPDPRTECCGVDSRVGNKIVGGNATTVDQYPWLVMIEYVQNGMTKLLCGGVLISGKYVLTAGHCVAGQVLTIGTPKRVRLGEYDISHEGPDCAAVEAGGEDCTEGVTRILIEKIIPHPQYNPVSALKRNDIALLRLKDPAPFTDFIRPICLPTKDLTVPPNIPKNFSLYAAGWGAVSDRKSYSNVKLHVDLPFVAPDQCQPAYSYPGRSVTLWKAQMCAGGVTGKDSCKGDSGGPLMYEDGRTYEVIGIVSFGPVPCGMDGVPGVYSKVYEYLDWIRSTIVP